MTDSTGEKRRFVIVFDIPEKETLNENRMPNNIYVLSKLSTNLRTMAGDAAVVHHDNPVLSAERLYAIRKEQDVKNAKSAAVKLWNKNKLKEQKRLDKQRGVESEYEEELTEEQVKEREAEEQERMEEFVYLSVKDLGPEVPSKDVPVQHMVEHFDIDFIIFPPTKRKFDPPNFNPTTKRIIDGFTDAGWWEDDNYEHLREVSFRHGGRASGKKGVYTFVMVIKELDEDDMQYTNSDFFDMVESFRKKQDNNNEDEKL